MCLLLLMLAALAALNIWYRRWLNNLTEEKRQQELELLRDEAQHWQL